MTWSHGPMGDPPEGADGVRVMKTATRTPVGEQPARTRFARRAPQRPDERTEVLVYDIDLDAGKLALAIVLSQPASRADYGVNSSDLLPPVTPVLTPSG